MSVLSRTANVLGAAALIVADQTENAIAATTGQSMSTAAALSALDEFLDRPTIDQVRRVLGLTPSGAVRLIDRLADAGLVTRGPGADGRSRAVVLTEKGRRVAGEIAAARERALATLLDGLTTDDQDTLHELMGRVMTNAVRIKTEGAWICRLCDFEACERSLGHCPAANAAQLFKSGR